MTLGASILNSASYTQTLLSYLPGGGKGINTINPPTSSGYTPVSDTLFIRGTSAFNGYPVPQTTSPFILTLSYPTTTLNPQNLKILRFSPTTNTWKPLPSSLYVLNPTSHTLSTTTTTSFGLYTLGYTNRNSSTTQTLGATTQANQEEPQPTFIPQPTPVSQPSPTPQETASPRLSFWERLKKEVFEIIFR